MMNRLADIALWTSRRLRLALLALIAVAGVKTVAAALDSPAAYPGAATPIERSATVAER